jgi:hypothetical protein
MTNSLSETPIFNLESLVQQIKPRWRDEFRHFVDTGNASDDFLAYLDNSVEGKQAVEAAFNAQADALKGIAEALKNIPTEPAVAEAVRPVVVASVKVAQAVEELLQLAPEQEEQAVEEAASALRPAVGQAGQARLQSVARTLESVLSRAAVND